MSGKNIQLRFLPMGKETKTSPGTLLLQAATQAGLRVNVPCGGGGTCGQCRVKVVQGLQPPNEIEKGAFEDAQLQEGWRLACQTTCQADMEVLIPEALLDIGQHQILMSSSGKGVQQINPAVTKTFVQLEPPSLTDVRGDRERLETLVGPLEMDSSQLQSLSSTLRQEGFTGTVVCCEKHFVAFERGDTCSYCYGLAFDIGTTTLVGTLLDLREGRILASESRLNPQVRFGDDVLSRIQHVASVEQGLEELNHAICGTIVEIMQQLCRMTDVSTQHVYEVVFAGNTTMQQLLSSLDPTPLGQMPYVPASNQALRQSVGDKGWAMHPTGRSYVLPVISGFVGGDIVAGILAAGLNDTEESILMVDLGTNGEIVLAHQGQLWAASTAAGPAFEGARIQCGMRGADGAIEKVHFGQDVTCKIIGGGDATGICGSALIDLVAGLLRVGIVDNTGRMLEPDQLPADLPEPLKQRVVLDKQGKVEFLLAEDRPGRRISLTSRDIRECQLAVGAIRAGIAVLLRQVGVSPAELDAMLIAGGMGNYLDADNARQIALIPAGITSERVSYIGNSALAGAQQVLLSTTVRKQAESLAGQVNHVELSLDKDFQTEFANAMIFPEPAC